ncbi:MAG TPA: DMT family transporter [Ottowia sp.]|mgnify:FL=1|uniref:DMT family transporter n=1 Tax=Ottowia sp. TaxID=1898956 RepID=UPI001B3FB21E|nr:DMT family transporter [Ottowia sp.]MBP6666845.1 DMT family transporter [Ottowia sp.]MBP7456788.1 DMT family transporter [Ottowia sp.]MBP7459633.1 DMT family transporter [Ottowia sp.]MBP8161006.1 DMT family transporter [Ottowia sp.]MBP8927743.1 DMT family transporter [Ottowia sp.]
MSAAVAAEFILLAALWGASFLFMRLGTLEFGPLPTAGLRVAIASLALLPVMLSRGLWPQLRQHWKPVMICGLINSAIPFALFSFALLSISTGLSSILNATVPLFGALVAWLWLGDKPGTSRTVGLVIGFIGVALLASGKASFKPDASGAVTAWGILACLLATISYAVAASFTRRYLSGLNSLMVATGSQIGAALGLALPTLLMWPVQAPSLKAWGALLALGILCTAVAYVLFFRLIEQLGPARAITVTFTIPVFAVFYGVTLLGETVTTWMLFCGVIVLCGTALATGLVKLPLDR